MQKKITEAIAGMVVCDLQPASVVEKKGFQHLIQLMDPRYTIVSRQTLQYTIIPKKAKECFDSIVSKLENIRSVSVTLDIWSSRRMHSYLCVTAHIINNEWDMQMYLLDCSRIVGRHTASRIVSDLQEILEKYKIEDRIFTAVTDNASNMKKAFNYKETVSLYKDDDDDDDDVDNEELDSEEDVSGNDDSDNESNCLIEDGIKTFSVNRINCFAHTLQLTVSDGLKQAKKMNSLIKKVGKVVNHVKKSTIATEQLEKQCGMTLVAKNDTRWNSQLKMVRRILQVDTNSVVNHQRDLVLTSHEKILLKEFVTIYERFEDATDLIQSDKYASISLAVPTIISLKNTYCVLNHHAAIAME